MKWLVRAVFIILVIALFFAIFSVEVKKGGLEVRLRPWIAKTLSIKSSEIKKKAEEKIKRVREKTKNAEKKVKKDLREKKEKFEEITREEQKKLEEILEKH